MPRKKTSRLQRYLATAAGRRTLAACREAVRQGHSQRVRDVQLNHAALHRPMDI